MFFHLHPDRHRGRRAAPGTHRTRSAIALGLFALLARSHSAAAQSTFEALFDLRLIGADARTVWLDAGLDKQRFGHDDQGLAVGAALFDLDAHLAPTVSVRATAAGYDRTSTLLHVTEAYVELAPVPRSAWRLRSRAGLFYPPVSLENSGVAWTSPYTLSFSAINTWIAEEIRAQGGEIELAHVGHFADSPHDFSATAAVFRGNDPAGALLSWRGWSMHDRQSGLFERLPLAPLPAFAPGGSFFPVQGALEKPFVELDGRWGYYAALRWTYLDWSEVRLLHYDNLGDPAVVENGQWAWRTRFDHLAWHWRPAAGTDVLAQALLGDTEMDGFTGPLVYARFWAAYILVSQELGRHRLSARLDAFGVRDGDPTPDDPNQEHGAGATAAYFYRFPAGHLGMEWRLGAELSLIRSARPARRLLGEVERRTEAAAQLCAQLRF
jgi:hypothetical protein